MLTARRGLATGIDYATLALPLGLLAGIVALRRSRSTAADRPPLSSARVRLIVAAGATLPLSCSLAAAEASGGSPGKRLLGFTVSDDTTDEAPTYPQALARTLLKTALPWELGHQAVWEFRADHTRRGAVLAAGAYAAIGWQAVAIARGARQTYPDRVAGTRVRKS
ncbi:RDD family protein [Kribbella sp. CA-294648]|uniref:RDD family protein n=1 Tax=Kribbella sp. CA-294648 TaxID=3239948 RepID=UPI003D8C60FC